MLLEDEIQRRLCERLLAQPAGMGLGPGGAAGIDPPLTQQERLQLLACAPQFRHRRFAGAHKLADRLMAGIGDPDCGEFAGTVQFGQRHCVAPVGLDPIARTPGRQ